MWAYVITVLIVIALSAALVAGLWKVSKWLLIPIQCILFAVLLWICIKTFYDSDIFHSLHKSVKESGIAELEKETISTAAREAEKTFTPSKTESQDTVAETPDNVELPDAEVPPAATVSPAEPETAPPPAETEEQEEEPFDILDYM